MAVAIQEVQTLQRAFRAKELARRPNAVKKMADGRYWVESQRNPGEGYIVNLAAETCGCPDFTRRNAPCKHLMLATSVAKASQPKRRIVIDEWDGVNVTRWHYADEPAATESKPAEPTCKRCGKTQQSPLWQGYCAPCAVKVYYGDN